MNYLIMNGSPHKGNTWKLVELIKEQLSAIDQSLQIKEIHLAEEAIPFCTGCSNCFRIGHEKCPHFSKIGMLIKEMEEADGIIIASTTYFMKPTSILKNFFDHLCFYMHRPHFFKSKALIVTTTGGVGARNAARDIASLLYGIGFNRCYLFGQASISWNAYKPLDKTKKKLSALTTKFHNDVVSKKLHSPTADLLIPYNLFRGMSLAYAKGSEYPTKDGEYWTMSERMHTIYDSQVYVPIYKRPIGHLFYYIGKYAGRLKNYQVTYRK